MGNGYAPQGEPIQVESSGLEHPGCALFGSLRYPPGEGVYTLHKRQRHQELQAHLETLLQRDPDAFYFVVLDKASAQTTEQLHEFRAQHQQQRELGFLPTYSPHLHLMERLWRLLRGQMTRSQFYPGLQALCAAVVEW